jgi:hypothetical protein
MDLKELSNAIKEAIFDDLSVSKQIMGFIGITALASFISYQVTTAPEIDEAFNDEEEIAEFQNALPESKRTIKKRTPASANEEGEGSFSSNNELELELDNTDLKVSQSKDEFINKPAVAAQSASSYNPPPTAEDDQDTGNASIDRATASTELEEENQETSSSQESEEEKINVVENPNALAETTQEDASESEEEIDITVDENERDSSISMTCAADMAAGTYGTSFSVNLSCSETATIKYCLQYGGGCCDPETTPMTYSTAVNINSGNGAYCLSYYGESTNSEITTVSEINYNISSIACLAVNFPKVQVQTTMLPLMNYSQASCSFGVSNNFYHQINFKSHDPTISGLNWSCEEMYNNYAGAVLTAPTPSLITPSLPGFDVSGLLSSAQIDQTVDGPNLASGDNYIAIIIENRDTGAFDCKVQKVIMDDFFVSEFTATGSTPVAAGVRKTSGGFVGFGMYRTPASLTDDSGSNENTQTNDVHESGFFSFLY